MSTAQHEEHANQEQQAAEQHAQQYSADAKSATQQCAKSACWTSTLNPTEQHKKDAEQHMKLATDHRAAAKALSDAESNACIGIAEEDRVTSPFYHREDITSVTKVERPEPTHRNVNETIFVGGRAVFRAVPGMTAEWLQRLVNCHMARAAAVGNSMPEMGYCPLELKGVNATVSSAGDGFSVEVTSDDPKIATEIWRRMEALRS